MEAVDALIRVFWYPYPLCIIHLTFLWPHDDVIKWKQFPRYWPFVWLHKGQLRGALIFIFDLRWNKRLGKQSWGCVLRCQGAHHHVIVMQALTFTLHHSPPIRMLLCFYHNNNNNTIKRKTRTTRTPAFWWYPRRPMITSAIDRNCRQDNTNSVTWYPQTVLPLLQCTTVPLFEILKNILNQKADTLQWRNNSAMASQITGVSIVYSTVRLGWGSKKTSKLHVAGLCEGHPYVTGGFPSQMANNAENISMWWWRNEFRQTLFPVTEQAPYSKLHMTRNPMKKKYPELLSSKCNWPPVHYGDVVMGVIAPQITSLTIVYSTVYSDADQRKYQSSASLAFVRGIHRGPVNSPHKWPVTRKMFSFDDVIMYWADFNPTAWLMRGWWELITPGCSLYDSLNSFDKSLTRHFMWHLWKWLREKLN